MKPNFLLKYFLIFLPFFSLANTIVVKDAAALNDANKNAKAGDTIILKNGNWSNVNVQLDCKGTKDKLILVKAENAGKVIISGTSKLSMGGSFIVVSGFYFTNGYAGSDPVIKFSAGKNKVANNCRLTNTVINDFNNPKRLDENYWIALYGKNNRIDHCSFLNKKNLGVLLAVILEDERSRENFHSIDHNYFGVRLPLASNAGEIIRVGVSQQATFNSNTQITDNYFEHCDGETEIISIKSCNNIIRNNFFKECQGGVVLRHGNYNTVYNNIFWGNNKTGTGGVRIINKGHYVVNNLFYKCRGEGFRSPMSVMNGVFNSPANRYVPVTDVVIMNNSFVECTPINLCEGSDTERTVAPQNVVFENNIFYNSKDSSIYNTYDDINGFAFTNNIVSRAIRQPLANGFTKTSLSVENASLASIPVAAISYSKPPSDSIKNMLQQRISGLEMTVPGFTDTKKFMEIQTNAVTATGAKWFERNFVKTGLKTIKLTCKNAQEIMQQIGKYKNDKLVISLTGSSYNFETPLLIESDVTLAGVKKNNTSLSSSASDFLIEIKAGKKLLVKNLTLDLKDVKTKSFITTDTSGSSNHCNFTMSNCTVSNIAGVFFSAAKSSVSDSIIINNCVLKSGRGILFDLGKEADKKGYYNVEHFKIINCTISKYDGQVVNILRSGNDESTMGPLFIFTHNKIEKVNSINDEPLVQLHGIQKTLIDKNNFSNCNENKTLISYTDEVRSVHVLGNNTLYKSGFVDKDKFVISDHL